MNRRSGSSPFVPARMQGCFAAIFAGAWLLAMIGCGQPSPPPVEVGQAGGDKAAKERKTAEKPKKSAGEAGKAGNEPKASGGDKGSADTAPKESGADEADASTESEASKESDDPAASPFAVPEDATEAELIDFIRQLNVSVLKQDDIKSAMYASAIASEQLFELAPTDEQKLIALSETLGWVEAAHQVASQEIEIAHHVWDTMASRFSDAEDPRLRELAAEHRLLYGASAWYRLSEKEQEDFRERLDAWLDARKPDAEAHEMVVRLGAALATSAPTGMAAELHEKLGGWLASSDDEALALEGEKLIGVARRLQLPGNPLEISGTTLDGEEFDWSEYEGKVVLVDFWATWCGPCIQELPNIMRNFERYYDQGFRVVGISLDQNPASVLAFMQRVPLPWPVLFGLDEIQTGLLHPMAVKYGVTGIPQVILVDREGNVVSLDARGAKLGRLLEEMLGPAGPERANDASRAPGGDEINAEGRPPEPIRDVNEEPAQGAPPESDSAAER